MDVTTHGFFRCVSRVCNHGTVFVAHRYRCAYLILHLSFILD